jgi:pimeloyl-ACP methyl ester carboxylesterase
VRDIESVVEATGLDKFDLLGVSQGAAISVAYAVRHPERVRHLVLYGGFARGRRMRSSQQEIANSDAIATLMRQGWGQENPAFRQMFTSQFIPGATAEQMEWFNDLQRITTSPDNAVRLRDAVDLIDVTDLLPRVHSRRFWPIEPMSAFPPILLQNSLLLRMGLVRKFCRGLVQPR